MRSRLLSIAAAGLAICLFTSGCEGKTPLGVPSGPAGKSEPAEQASDALNAGKSEEDYDDDPIIIGGMAGEEKGKREEPDKDGNGGSEGEDAIIIGSAGEYPGGREAEDGEEKPSFEGYILSENDVSENGVYLKSVSEEGVVRIVFAGDINFDDHYTNMVTLRSRGGIEKCIDPRLIERMRNADICMLNNEFPYSDRGTPTPGKKFTFRADPSTVRMLDTMGVDIVSLANNHAYDHGEEALLDTFDTLKGASIPYVGAGHDIEEASKSVCFIAGGMKIAFVSATQIERSLPPDTKEAEEDSPGVLRTLDPSRFIKVIEEADQNSDFCIVYVHWGSEGTNHYEQSQHDLAAAYAKAGADLIVGDHPHVLQGFEYVEGVPVMYSLGNYWFNSKSLDTCLLEAVITGGELKELKFIPCRQSGCYTSEALRGGGDYERILEQMRGFSNGVNISGEGIVSQ